MRLKPGVRPEKAVQCQPVRVTPQVVMRYRDRKTGNTLTVNSQIVSDMMDANSGRYVRLEDAPAAAAESAAPTQKKTRRRK